MIEDLTTYEPTVRLFLSLGIFAAVALWEVGSPLRTRPHGRLGRWVVNLGISFVDTLTVRILFPAAGVGVAMVIAERGWGLLQQVQLPAPIAIALSVLALDFAIYLQHLLFHTVPWLWRLHLVHHADTEFDVTTAVRFHPIEIVISMLWKLACIAMLGPPAVAVLIFEVLLNATSMFNHANARLPQRLEPIVRWVIVTPDMHRVHHSTVRAETNSNFGFSLPWWDRMLGTYCDQPAAGHDAMQIGLDPPPAPAPIGLGGLLALPFRAPQSAYPLARRDDASGPGRPT